MNTRSIYLASDSKARKKLLRMFGLKFKVISSGAVERDSAPGANYASLVKRNARAKAAAAARKVPCGIIIAADTIVVDNGRIFGKPKNRRDAHRMLKALAGRSQWIYSGICVLDKATGKMRIASEKTKIYMDPLSDSQIEAYFRYVNPLDKAGSFDVQGRGGFFIRRIEGCFYNVVGLPVRRLYRMLKEFGIKIFMFLLVAWCLGEMATLLSGCSAEYNIATRQEDTLYYSTEKEVKLGEAMSRQFEKEYKLVADAAMQQRVQAIGAKIAAVCDRKDIVYFFKVVDDKEVNALSLPGGYIYINRGLVEKVKNDDELAGVISHEIAHIAARHSVKRLQAVMGYSLVRVLAVSVAPQTAGGGAADLAFAEILTGYGRQDELLSDQLATRYLRMAGYDPYAMISFLETLAQDNRHKPLRPRTYLKTHPYVPDRIRIVRQELGEPIRFKDYINIEDRSYE